MILKELLEGLELEYVNANMNMEINSIAYDSKRVGEKSLFVAIRGFHEDGHNYISEAVKNGAVCIVAEEIRELKKDTAFIKVRDSRRALAHIASVYYKKPSKGLNIIGVTGTNGKTTTCHIIKHIIEAVGRRADMLCTLYNIVGGKKIPSSLTTPQSLELQAYLRQSLDSGIDYVILEVSSHALSLHRLEGCSLREAAITNITRDHMDFHKTTEAYVKAKESIMEYVREGGTIVINADDPASKHLDLLRKDIKLITCGIKEEAHLYAHSIERSSGGLSFKIKMKGGTSLDIRSRLAGFHNVYNILIAVALTHSLGIDGDSIVRGVDNVEMVSGRFEKISIKEGAIAIVDYAHTDDALRRLLTEVRAMTKGRVIAVFGCGGNRDRGKRPIMGGIAVELSDLVILTNDNPRYEEPMDIIRDIMSGIE
ncbi:MAG: UDP-N-acetylmuramoyl-L-alanyl-D-glutamate--2,6-diaminopimelate ligase, partial [Nitrospirae bacterium]